MLAGAELDECKKAEIARGTLPPGHLALPVLEEIGAVVAQLAAAAKGLGGDGPPGSLDVNLALPDGRTLAGTVTGVCGDTIRAISYSRVRPRDRLRAWVRLLAISAARPERPFQSLVIGRARTGAYQADVTVARILPVGEDPAARSRAAVAQLAALIDLYDRGMREPLPMSSDASAAYAQAAAAGHDGAAAADKAWTSTFDYPKEDRKPEHLRGVRRRDRDFGPAGDQAPRPRGLVPGRDEPLRRLRAPAVGGPARPRGDRRSMTAVSTYTDFDVCGPLPSGVTVLEASAGTGKTYTIAALTARYVAEGTPLDRLLLITFTRMATGELRDRVRERLIGCEQALSRILAGASDPETDPVVTLLASGSPDAIGVRRDRLARAVADFDAATIATTHGFCQEVLAELGTVGDLDRETAFVEDVSNLLEQALDDLYVRRFHRRETARFKRAEALKIARAAVDNPMAELEPRDEPTDSTAAMRYRLAKAVRSELEQRKRRLAIMTYDDLLTRLKDTLDGPSGEAARARLRSRFDVVLVDEFQDTDPIQWQILDRAFAKGGVTLVLVADPKQAIYAFRGADVYAYLKAAEIAGARATLRENRRADQTLIDAYDALFAGAKLGHEGIAYRQVRATPAHRTPRLTGAPSDAALRVRVVHRDDPTIELTQNGFAVTDSVRSHVARDLAADVVALLSSNARIEHRAPDGEPIGDEPLCPRHIAVLVRRNADAEHVQDELLAADVPAVLNGAGSVFATRSARHWLGLLEAIERPASPIRARTAALTPFSGVAGRADRHCLGRGVGGRPPAPPPLEPDPARSRCRGVARGDHGR